MKISAGPGLTAALCLLAGPLACEERLDFPTRVLPVLTKAGCNGGACHGAATGQGGFKLSLLGYDPEEDYLRITREHRGRRIDLEAPEDSLLLRKPLRLLPHRGGRRFPAGSPAHQTIRAWIAAGAPYGPHDLRVARVEVVPPEVLLAAPGATASLRVTATLSDGTREEVTPLALHTSNDDGIAEVDADGKVTARAPGLTSIMVRYGGEVAAARIAVPFAAAGSIDWTAFAPRCFIDQAVLDELRRLRLPPSPLADDAEFLRRVSLDLAGRLPAADEARAFVAEPPSSEKRERAIDRLLESEAFTDLWTLRLAEVLLVGGRRASGPAAGAYHRWLRDQVAHRAPLDRMAREILTATGDAREVGPAGFYLLASDPRDLAEHASRMFLGTQIACARCHSHPAARWTRDDYHAFAAYFARVERDGDLVRAGSQGEVEDPRTGLPVAPRPLGPPAVGAPEPGADRRVALAAWVTSPANPLFARALVNRVWKLLLGHGLVEPADDLRETNPPSIPALLDALARDFTASGHDLRRLVRTIALSRTYQLTCRATEQNRLDERLFSHASAKPLAGEVLLDALSQASGVAEPFPGFPAGTRAVELPGAGVPSRALDILGRCSRERSCESAARAAGGIAQALDLINGSTINAKLGGGVVAAIAEKKLTDREAVAELYLRCLGRFPDDEERAQWEPLLARATDRGEALEDLLWAILNSREFAFNH